MQNANNSNEKIKLLSELQQNCSLVESAINHLMKCKKHVEDNALEVKFQINGNATSALDALRKREVQLLRQVDVMQAQHLDLLQAHYAKLHQILGNLKQSLHCVQINKYDGPQCLSAEDVELARIVQQQKVIPDSIGYIGDAQKLISHIESFGKISAYYNFLASQQKEDLVSKCLPSRMEDYGDCEHQLLYKTLEEIRLENNEPKEFKESCKNDGWLKNYSEPPQETSWNRNFAFVLPEYLVVKEKSYWLRNSSVDSESPGEILSKERHIQDWLQHLKQQDAYDNLNFKRNFAANLCNKDAASIETESIEMISNSEMSDATGFSFVISPTCDSKQVSWLRTMANKEQMKQDRSHCFGRENIGVDIEDIIPYNAHAPTTNFDRNMWLVKNNSKNAIAMNESVFDITDACCANEPCTTYRDCVCKDKCAQKAYDKLFAINSVTNALSCDTEWIRKSFQDTVRLDENPKWLHPNFSNDEKLEFSEKKFKFGSDLLNNSDITLASNETLGGSFENIRLAQDNALDSNWLSNSSLKSPMDCNDFIREDFKMYFQKNYSHMWIHA